MSHADCYVGFAMSEACVNAVFSLHVFLRIYIKFPIALPGIISTLFELNK